MATGGSQAAAAMSAPAENTCTAMKLKGLPFSVTREDVLKFFEGYGMLENSVKVGKMADGRLTGEAAVLFDAPTSCQTAHTEKNH